MKGLKKYLNALIMSAVMMSSLWIPLQAEESGILEMYRLYNPNTGEHFYTAKAAERDHLAGLGWIDEGTGWYAPAKSETPVYRLYNRNGGEHHYTLKEKERDALVKAGWTDEGIGWYSDDAKVVPVFRDYNPNAKSCNHNYTVNYKEHGALDQMGWNDEGVGWYGTAEFTDLHHYDCDDFRIYSAFDDRDIGAENGMHPEGLLYAMSDETTIDFSEMDESICESMGFHKGDSLKKMADLIVRDDQKNKSFYTVENRCIEELSDSLIRITRTITYPPNEYYEGSSQFEVTGLFMKDSRIYLLTYSCDKQNRSEYEAVFNDCLGKSLYVNE